MAAPLVNSRRSARMASYTPINFSDPAEDGGGVVTTAGLIRSLGIVQPELEALRLHATTREAKGVVDAIAALVDATSADQILAASPKVASVPKDALVDAVDQIRTVRHAALTDAVSALGAPSNPSSNTTPDEEAPTGEKPPTALAEGSPVAATLLAGSRFRSHISTAIEGDLGTSPMLVSMRSRLAVSAVRGAPAQKKGAVALASGSGQFYAPSALIPIFLNLVEPYLPPGTDLASVDALAALDEIDRKATACNVVIDALSRKNVQPLGLLHLELLEMTPSSVERGELVYSLPMAPNEKVTLSHKEWAVRESAFTEFVQDSIENYSEQGVAETDEIAISSETESKKVARSGMGSSGGVQMTGPADAGSSVVSDSQSRQESTTHSKAITTQASSRATRDHKVSFTVATVSGTEDFTSRLIENPHADRAMRIDYYRRMRKWDVGIFRTGVRLAYDVVIPDPGRRLRLRQDLIRQYDRALAGTFNPGLSPTDVGRYNWQNYAAAYGVALPPPPVDPDTSTAFKQWQVSSFSALRDAAYAKYSQVQETLRQRRSDLARQIDTAADADTMRQMEREEIARLTLAWIVPGFPGASAAPSTIGDPQGLSDASWQQTLEFGEYIKFVHAAIDWPRLAWFLYPYFWSDRQVDRLYLQHPDRSHRDFLRAGAARVIVPIVPGFEEQLAAFIDLGRIGKLPNGHRFTEVIKSVQEANKTFAVVTNQQQVVTSPETLLGTWAEFTPTGALDIEVCTIPVQAQ